MDAKRHLGRFGLHTDSTVLAGDPRASRTRAVGAAFRRPLEENKTDVLPIRTMPRIADVSSECCAIRAAALGPAILTDIQKYVYCYRGERAETGSMGRIIEVGSQDFPQACTTRRGPSPLCGAVWRRIPPSVKALKGFGGRAVLEIVAPHEGDTWRTVYTVRFQDAVYVLHAFQKKSKRGIATPQKELELVKQRLAAAERDYRERQN